MLKYTIIEHIEEGATVEFFTYAMSTILLFVSLNKV